MLVSFLDNAKGMDQQEPTHPNSRGLLLALRMDTEPKTASIVKAFEHPDGPGAHAPRRGSVQFSPNGNVFIDWSEQARQSEHTTDGSLILDSKLQPEWLGTYRSYKFDKESFVGKSNEVIAVHSESHIKENGKEGPLVVHVSWNGDTEVVSSSLTAAAMSHNVKC
jgi:hypothetical protein